MKNVVQLKETKPDASDMIAFVEDLLERVKTGDVRYLAVQYIQRDGCPLSANTGNASFIEKIGLLNASIDIEFRRANE